MGLGNHDLSCAYFSKTSRSYSSRTALRETCPFRSLAIFRRSGSVGALDVRLNLAKNRVGADDVLPNSRSNHSMVSSRTDRRLRHYHREFRGQKDSVTALCEERHRKWISIPTILTRRAKHPPSRKIASTPFCENIPLYRNSVLRHSPAIPVQGEGRSYVVTNVGRGAVDAAAPGTRRWDQGEMNLVRSRLRADGRRLGPAKPGRLRTAKARGPDRRCYGQALRRWVGAQPGLGTSPIREVTEARRNSAPGRARISRQTIAQGRPGVFRPTCCPACASACANSSRGGSWVPAGTRPSLRPLHLERVKETSKTRTLRAARTLRYV
ncbi:hypothetical protein ACVIHA_004739 [Bradyrhizobium liaoningense]